MSILRFFSKDTCIKLAWLVAGLIWAWVTHRFMFGAHESITLAWLALPMVTSLIFLPETRKRIVAWVLSWVLSFITVPELALAVFGLFQAWIIATRHEDKVL